MTKILETQYEDHNHHVFFCDCSSGHFIDFDWWDEDDDGWPVYMEVNETYHPQTFFQRFKFAWQMLMGNKHYHSGVLLNEQNLRSIREMLNEKLDK